MGLISGIYNMVRQSEQDDINNELRKRAYEHQMDLYNETNRQRTEAFAGLTALQEIKKNMSEAQQRKDYLESIYPATMASDPEKGFSVSSELKSSKDRVDYLRDIEQIKKAQTYFNFVDSSKAPAMTANYVGQMLGMKNTKVPDDNNYVEVEQKTTDSDTGTTTTKKWKEKSQGSSQSDYSIGSQAGQDQASVTDRMQQGFNDYQTGGIPNLSQSGYSSGFGNSVSGNYLAGSGGSYMSGSSGAQQVQPDTASNQPVTIPSIQEQSKPTSYTDVGSLLASKGIQTSQIGNPAAVGGGRKVRNQEDVINESRSRLNFLNDQLESAKEDRNSRGNTNIPFMQSIGQKIIDEQKKLDSLTGATITPNVMARPQADTEAVRQQALAALSEARTPEQRQKIKERAAQMGVNLP
jgi:hypothetical protein